MFWTWLLACILDLGANNPSPEWSLAWTTTFPNCACCLIFYLKRALWKIIFSHHYRKCQQHWDFFKKKKSIKRHFWLITDDQYVICNALIHTTWSNSIHGQAWLMFCSIHGSFIDFCQGDSAIAGFTALSMGGKKNPQKQ